jgi:hypothetical protein
MRSAIQAYGRQASLLPRLLPQVPEAQVLSLAVNANELKDTKGTLFVYNIFRRRKI